MVSKIFSFQIPDSFSMSPVPHKSNQVKSAPAENEMNNFPVLDKAKVASCNLVENPEDKTLTLTVGDSKIVLKMNSDITKQKSDFIVNAANEEMLGGGGVDGAIGRAGGEELFLFRQSVPEVSSGVRCPVGEARITDAGRLPCLFCIHAVGPRFDMAHHNECRAQLLHAYTDSLKAAQGWIDCLKENNADPKDSRRPIDGAEMPQNGNQAVLENARKLRKEHEQALGEKIQRGDPISISFPTISTGIFGYPKQEGALLSLKAALEFLQNHQGKTGIKTIEFVFLDQQPDVPYYEQALKQIHKAWEGSGS